MDDAFQELRKLVGSKLDADGGARTGLFPHTVRESVLGLDPELVKLPIDSRAALQSPIPENSLCTRSWLAL
ncbi:MAG: hypothetical protein H0U72_13965 [Nitrosospira sp.]|nr:hypothetical protein [Nitrosospira sp.]